MPFHFNYWVTTSQMEMKGSFLCVAIARVTLKNTAVSNCNFDWLEREPIHVWNSYNELNYRENVKRSIDSKPLRYSLPPPARCVLVCVYACSLSCDSALLYTLNLHTNPNNSAHVLHGLLMSRVRVAVFSSRFQKLHVISISGPWKFIPFIAKT